MEQGEAKKLRDGDIWCEGAPRQPRRRQGQTGLGRWTCDGERGARSSALRNSPTSETRRAAPTSSGSAASSGVVGRPPPQPSQLFRPPPPPPILTVDCRARVPAAFNGLTNAFLGDRVFVWELAGAPRGSVLRRPRLFLGPVPGRFQLRARAYAAAAVCDTRRCSLGEAVSPFAVVIGQKTGFERKGEFNTWYNFFGSTGSCG